MLAKVKALSKKAFQKTPPTFTTGCLKQYVVIHKSVKLSCYIYAIGKSDKAIPTASSSIIMYNWWIYYQIYLGGMAESNE